MRVLGDSWGLLSDLSLSNMRIYCQQNYDRGLTTAFRHRWWRCRQPARTRGGASQGCWPAGRGWGGRLRQGRGRNRGTRLCWDCLGCIFLCSLPGAPCTPLGHGRHPPAPRCRPLRGQGAQQDRGAWHRDNVASLSTQKGLADSKRVKYCRVIQIRKCIAPKNVPALSRVFKAHYSSGFRINLG